MPALSLSFRCLNFQDLSKEDLYRLLRLRAEVFIVEQQCPFQDLDNADQESLHVLGELNGELVCYARLLPAGVKFPAASIGRVVSAQSVRRDGFGRALMGFCLHSCREHWPQTTISISAQSYLEKFYQSFGFVTVRGPYPEDGIPHLEMHLGAESELPLPQGTEK